MKNYQTARSGILALLLMAFSFVHGQAYISYADTIACNGATAPAVTFTITGGSGGSYNYVLYNLYTGANQTQSSPVFTNVPLGYYSIYASNSLDSVYSRFSVVPLITLTTTVTNTTCPANTGSIVAVASGGSAPYTYNWSNSASGSTISNLGGGGYTVTVTDVNGCIDTMSANVIATSPMVVTIAQSGSLCNPVLTASATGGTGSVSYHWSSGATTAAISSLSAFTNYSVTATDANGCTAVQYAYIGSTSLAIDSLNGGSVSVVNPSCISNTGSITLHVRSGTRPYSFVWSGSSSTDSIASGLVAGSYTVTVTDANGCSGINSYYLSNSNQMFAYFCSYTQPTCGSSDGSLNACAYGGSGSYTYLWGTGATTASLTGLPAGTYTVTATDQGGCSSTNSYTLVGTANYTVSVTTTPTACDTSLHTGTATAIIAGTGGTAPYNYTWYNTYYYPAQVLGTTQTISNLSYMSNISVSVTDANGCSPVTTYDSAYIFLDPACFDHITGYVFNDSINNCLFDPSEHGLGGTYVSATSATGQTYYASTDSSGYYDMEVQPGAYTVTVNYYNFGYCSLTSCNQVYHDTFTVISQTSANNNFGANLGASTFNLGVHPGCTVSTPGATKDYWVYYFNNGTTNATGAVVTFTHDPNLTLVSSTPAYTSYNSTTHVVTWNVGTVAATSGWSAIRMTFDVPSSLTLGTYLTSVAEIDPITGDCDPSDNIVSMSDMVSGSHDPNEKEVSPVGNLTASDSVLTYTLRFQNNGNAPASIVIIKDTLSANVDPNTVVPGASSHPYNFSLSGKGILTFTFNNINLPDSVHDVAHSKGFVNYTVHTKHNLPLGAQVKNTAYIYFDINPAVVTNTTVNNRSDFATSIKNVNGDNGLAVTVSPNPVQDKSIVHITGASGEVSFDLIDVRGQKVMETKTTSSNITLDSQFFAPGVYVYTVRDISGNSRSGKVLITH